MKRREKEVFQATLDDERALLSQIEQNYINALADIKKKIKKLQERGDTQSIAYQIQFQRQMEEQINRYLDILELENVDSIHKYLEKCYETGFIGNLYQLQDCDVNVVAPINQRTVIRATRMTADGVKLSKKIKGNTELLKKQVVQEMQRGFSTSMPYLDIARNISDRGESDLNRAMRIARTEGNRIYNEAALDSAQAAVKAGVDTVKQWVAILDGRTRESHQRVDGEWVELNDKFSNGLFLPGDKNAPAAEIVNCRCKAVFVPRWEVDSKAPRLRMDNIEKKVIEADNFQDWRQKYYSAIDNLRKDVIIDNKTYSYINDSQWQRLMNLCRKNESADEHRQIWRHQSQKQKAGYVQTNNSFEINAALRAGDTSTLKPDDLVTIRTLNDVIDRTQMRDCIIADRYCDEGFLDAVFGVKLKSNRVAAVDDAVNQLKAFIGITKTEPAFMSVSLKSDKNVFTDRHIKMKVLLEDGKSVYVTNNRVESEAILHTGTKYRLLDVNRLTDHKGNSWVEMLIKIIK